MRVEAGVAITGQVQVALYHQVTVRGAADDLHPWAQMERIGIRAVVEPGELVVEQVRVEQGRVDKRRAQCVLAIQVSLVDLLIRSPAGRRVVDHGRIVVCGHAVERDRACALDCQAATGVDVDVVAAAIGIDQPWRVQFKAATREPVVVGRTGGAVTQVDAHAIGEGQAPVAGAEHHHGTVRRVDDLAVAVHPQFAAVGIQHGTAVQAQAVLAGQVDAAHAFTAGIHQASDTQAAVVYRDADVAGLEAVADGQVALLELEAARAEHLPNVEAAIEVGKLLVQRTAAAQALGLDLHAARQIRHQGAARVVVAAAAAQERALQVDDPARRIQRHGPQRTRLVVLGRQVDGRACRLMDIAGAAVEGDVAAPAVLGHIVEGDRTPGDINQRRVRQLHITPRCKADLAARQHHGARQTNAVAVQGQLGTLPLGLAACPGRRRHINRATGSDAVD